MIGSGAPLASDILKHWICFALHSRRLCRPFICLPLCRERLYACIHSFWFSLWNHPLLFPGINFTPLATKISKSMTQGTQGWTKNRTEKFLIVFVETKKTQQKNCSDKFLKQKEITTKNVSDKLWLKRKNWSFGKKFTKCTTLLSPLTRKKKTCKTKNEKVVSSRIHLFAGPVSSSSAKPTAGVSESSSWFI